MDLSNRTNFSSQGGGRRVLPNSIEAEESIIGGILLHAKAFAHVADIVQPEDFYHPVLGVIYRAMVDLDVAGQPIDTISVARRMQENETYVRLRAFNGEAYFAELMNKVVTVDNIAYHAKLVRGTSTVRRTIIACQEIAAKGYGDYSDPEAFVQHAERTLYEITARERTGSYVPLRQLIRPWAKTVEARYDHKGSITGVPSGFTRLDAFTLGFQPASLNIIAGRPSMGKTSLAMNTVAYAAHAHGIRSLLFSLETSREAILERFVAQTARVDSMRLRSGFLDQRDWINVTKACSFISEYPIWIDDTSAPTILDIRAKARRWRSDPDVFRSPDDLGIIVVDYLQLVEPTALDDRRGQSRERDVAEISRGLKALAKELRVPVVAISQLNRACESRADKRPMLSDLRDSGAIEQDADLIAFLYRDEVYNKESSDKGTAEVIIGKQRDGAVGAVRLAFLGAYTRFENLADPDVYGHA